MPQPLRTAKLVGGFLPSDQRRILQLHRQGQRPGQIAHTLRLPPGGFQRIYAVLDAAGLTPPQRVTQA